MLEWTILAFVLISLGLLLGVMSNIIERLERIEETNAQNYDLPARIELEARLQAEFAEKMALAERLQRWEYDHSEWQQELRRAREDAGEIVGLEEMVQK